MLLALSVLGPQGAELGSLAYKVFDHQGGSIGRQEGNDWTLPDPDRFLSTRHATVSLRERHVASDGCQHQRRVHQRPRAGGESR